MMVAAPRLSESLQALVDLRLDTIDRMLLDRVPRQDRVNIVGEVEAQIFELLEQRGVEEPDRDDVLAVLSRIDPPEAYVPEGAERRVASESPRVVATLSSDKPLPEAGSSLARTSGILGLASLCGTPVAVTITYIVALAADSAGIDVHYVFFGGLFGTAFLKFLSGLFAVVLAIYMRLRGAWAITGLLAGGWSMLVSTIQCAVSADEHVTATQPSLDSQEFRRRALPSLKRGVPTSDGQEYPSVHFSAPSDQAASLQYHPVYLPDGIRPGERVVRIVAVTPD